jgi:hypothetical protein
MCRATCKAGGASQSWDRRLSRACKPESLTELVASARNSLMGQPSCPGLGYQRKRQNESGQPWLRTSGRPRRGQARNVPLGRRAGCGSGGAGRAWLPVPDSRTRPPSRRQVREEARSVPSGYPTSSGGSGQSVARSRAESLKRRGDSLRDERGGARRRAWDRPYALVPRAFGPPDGCYPASTPRLATVQAQPFMPPGARVERPSGMPETTRSSPL